MKKQLRFLMLTLLCAVFSTTWGADEVFYTLTPANGSNSSYTGNCDITIGGITWNLEGNSQMNPWRIGGKNITKVDRSLYSKTKMGNAISKVTIEVGAASGITVHSTKLIVASDASFNNKLDEVSVTFSPNSALTFTPTSGTEWATDAYYKFVFNVTVSGTSNKFIEFKKATFYKLGGGVTLIDPELSFPEASYNATLGEAFTAPALSTASGLDGKISYTSSKTSVATVASDGAVTLVGAGTTTIKASSDQTKTFKAGEASYTLTVVDPNASGTENNPYTVVDALALIQTLGTSSSDYVYVSGIVSSKNSSLSSGALTYFISDDGESSNALQVYKGKYLNNVNFTSADQIAVGDRVTVYGKLKKYNSTPEFDSGNYIVKHESAPTISAPTISVPSGNVSEGTTVIITAEEGLWISYTTDGTDPTNTTVDQWVTNNVANVIINNTCTLKAIAIDPEELDKSEVVEVTYTVAGSEQVVFEIVTDASSLNAGDEIVLVSHHDYTLYAMGEQKTNNRAGVALADEFKGGAYPTQLASNNDVAIITLEGSSTAWNFKVDGGYLYAASSSSNHLKTEKAVDAGGNANATITISGDEHDAAIKFNGDHTRNNLKFNNSDDLFSCYASGQQTVKIYRKTTTTPQPDAPVIWMSYSSANDLDFTNATDYTAFVATNYKSEEKKVVLTKIKQVPAGVGIVIRSNDPTVGISTIFSEADVQAEENDQEYAGVNMLVGMPNGGAVSPEGFMAYDNETPAYHFVLAKRDGVVGFYKLTAGNLRANRAYLQIPKTAIDTESSANGISFAVEGEETAIQGVTTTATADDAWYTLQGVRVAQPTRGLYIHNGKKVVVK